MNAVLEQMAYVIHQKQYSDAELKSILRGWRNLLEDSFIIPNEHVMILQTVDGALQKLDGASRVKGERILLEALRCMLHKWLFNADELNQLLIDCGIEYHYALHSNAAIKGGEYKVGYKEKKETDCLFISHSYEDRKICDAFVELLESLGLSSDAIFYSSMPEYGVGLGENILDVIKGRLVDKKVHVIYMLSPNYYSSAMCLNEMGAVWILRHTYTSILLPGYDFKDIKGVIASERIGIKLDGDTSELRARFIQFRNQIQQEFDLVPIEEIIWNRKLDAFLNHIKTRLLD